MCWRCSTSPIRSTGPFFEETLYVTPSRLPAAFKEAIATCTARTAKHWGWAGARARRASRERRRAMATGNGARSIGGLCSRSLRFGPGISLEELILQQALGLDPTAHSRVKRDGVRGHDAADSTPRYPASHTWTSRSTAGTRYRRPHHHHPVWQEVIPLPMVTGSWLSLLAP